MKKLKFRAIGLVCATLFAGSAMAQQVTLRLHQFLPPQATIPAKAIIPWAQKVEKESGGKIKVQMFHAMQMGGSPAQLFDQAKDGVAFAFSMNKATYDKLPPDLKKVIDNNSGLEAAAMFGRAMDEGDKAGRDIAAKAGNNLVTLDAAETQRWLRTASSVESDWVTEVAKKGIDGKKLASEALALIAKYNR